MNRRTGCVLLLGTIVMLGAMLGFLALQSGMAISEIGDIGGHDLGGASALRGVDDARRRIDLAEVQASAVEHVKKRWPDATLVAFNSDNVSPDGFADLTLGKGATLTMSIASPSLVSKLPKGAAGSDKPECVSVVMDQRNISFATRNLPVCAKALESGVLPTLPKCSVKQIWARAIEKGAPATGAVANVSYTPGYGFWHVRVGDGPISFKDDC